MRRITTLAVVLGVLVTLVATAEAATLGPTQVFSDAIEDGVFLAEATPPYQDLVAGYITETDDTIDITWEVVDLPDEPLYVPEVARFFFEFSLIDQADLDAYVPEACDVADCFSVRASITRSGSGSGELTSNCVTDDTNTTRCQPVSGAQVTVTYDGAADQVTASVRRSDMRDGFFGPTVATDGKILLEESLFQGIAAYTGTSVLTSGATGDQADLDAGCYTLGGGNGCDLGL